MKTIVVFRKMIDNGNLIALFPNETVDQLGGCGSYQHVGQHGASDYKYCMAKSTAPTIEEYQDLQLELESLGYDLQVMKRHRKPKVVSVVDDTVDHLSY